MCEGASKQTPDLKILPRRDRPVLKFLDPPLSTLHMCWSGNFIFQQNNNREETRSTECRSNKRMKPRPHSYTSYTELLQWDDTIVVKRDLLYLLTNISRTLHVCAANILKSTKVNSAIFPVNINQIQYI